MLNTFIDSVLIIDDKEAEIQELKQILEKEDIWVTYFNPPKEKQEIEKIKQPFRNRKLIFLDLRIDEDKSTIDNISGIIRPLLKNTIASDFGNYGIVMWTKHDNHISEFKAKIQKDSKLYQLPLFVVRMDKSKYLRYEFKTVLKDLEEQLKNSTAANFFITWSNLIDKGRNDTIKSIFELIPDYQKQDKNLEFLLFKMAQNFTGLSFDEIDHKYPLSIDAIKSFNDLLVSEINSMSEITNLASNKNENFFILSDEDTGWHVKNTLTDNKKNLNLKKITKDEDKGKINWSIEKDFTNKEKSEDKLKAFKKEIICLFSKLNSKLLIDEINIKQDKVIPGNVYIIRNGNSKLKHPDLPSGAKPIVIEMTPPCDFSSNKTRFPRVLSGYIKELDLSKPPTSEKMYKELWPLKLKETDNPQIIIFDFSMLGFVKKEDLKDENKYKLLFRVKDKLFADILQKMSAYAARLGLSIIR